MNKRIGIWAACAAVSGLAHGGALLALTLATTPDPIEDQPTPKSRLNIESQEVDRVTATETDAPSEQAPEGAADATQIGQGTIRQSNAVAAELTPQKTTATEPAAQTQSTISTSATALKPAAPKATPTESVSATKTATAALATNATPAAFLRPQTTKTAAAETQAADAPTLVLPAEKGTASLAWSGDGAMDPVSLAAIQAFMQPGDATQNTDTVRDGISALLASVPCARLQTTFIPETGELQLRGHIPDPDMRGPILAALTDQVGTAIPVSDELLILPRPQCGALSGIANVGLPQSTDQITNPRVVGPSGFARNYTYTNGQRLELELNAPDYDGYIYVDYFTADGNVLHLQPNTVVPLEFVEAKSQQSVGKVRDNKPFLELTVSPPFGQEIAAAFASSVPLYDDLRPIQEPTAPYLEFLKERVATARSKNPDFKGEWVYFFISTKEN
jgi:hypothetical protein